MPWEQTIPDAVMPSVNGIQLLPIGRLGRNSQFFLKSVAVGFAGSNPQGMIDRRHEDLAVADLSGARAGRNHLDRLVGNVSRNRDFDPQLRQKIHDILRAAIDFRVTLLTAVTLDLGNGHAVDANGGQRLPDLVQLEGFDNSDNKLHVQAFIFPELRSSSIREGERGVDPAFPPPRPTISCGLT